MSKEQRFDIHQHIFDFLSVRSDILHRNRSRSSRNAREVFDTPQIMLDREFYDIIPHFAGRNSQGDRRHGE